MIHSYPTRSNPLPLHLSSLSHLQRHLLLLPTTSAPPPMKHSTRGSLISYFRRHLLLLPPLKCSLSTLNRLLSLLRRRLSPHPPSHHLSHRLSRPPTHRHRCRRRQLITSTHRHHQQQHLQAPDNATNAHAPSRVEEYDAFRAAGLDHAFTVRVRSPFINSPEQKGTCANLAPKRGSN